MKKKEISVLISQHPFCVPRNIKMSIVWSMATIVCLAFAAIPWFFFITGRARWPSLGVMGFVVFWSSLPCFLGLWMGYFAVCKIELQADRGVIHRSMSLAGLKFKKTYQVSRVSLVRQWHHSKRGPVAREVIFLHAGPKKQRFMDELTCRDLEGLANWLANATGAKQMDARRHNPVG